jgi:hypothetical protein
MFKPANDNILKRTTKTGNLDVGVAEAGLMTLIVRPIEISISMSGSAMEDARQLAVLAVRNHGRVNRVNQVSSNNLRNALEKRHREFLLRACLSIVSSRKRVVICVNRFRPLKA